MLALLTTLLLGISPANADWGSPLPDAPVTRVFDLKHGPYRAGHRGVDLLAPQGSRVIAPESGEVTFAGTVVDRPVLSLLISGRYLLSVEPVVTQLQPGDRVRRGETLGTVQGVGHCAASCVHLGVREDGMYLNPVRFFGQFRPRLLPLRERARTQLIE